MEGRRNVVRLTLGNTFAQETNTIGNVTLSRNRAGCASHDARSAETAPQKREGIGVR